MMRMRRCFRQVRYSMIAVLLLSGGASRALAQGDHQHAQAEQELTPEQTRTHRVARAVARDLLQLSGPRVRPELCELAERFGVTA